MSQTLTLELSDEIYTIIQRQAAEAGTSPAHWIAATLEHHYGSTHGQQHAGVWRTEAERQAARERFERHFGEVELVDSIGADNEQIDAELAREYDDSHETP